MTKSNTQKGGRSGTITFHPVVPTYLPPIIDSEYVDDDGNLNYVLKNGNTTLADKYNSIWRPTRSEIDWNTKGENCDKTKVA